MPIDNVRDLEVAYLAQEAASSKKQQQQVKYFDMFHVPFNSTNQTFAPTNRSDLILRKQSRHTQTDTAMSVVSYEGHNFQLISLSRTSSNKRIHNHDFKR